MKKILIYGGTFDPVHRGHVNAFESAKALVSPDLSVIIPNKIPPHKERRGLASGEDRMNMLRLTFGESEDILYSDYELRREGKSYSLYTLQHFYDEFKDSKLYFIIGSDSILSFHKWFEYKKILKLCTLVCVSRVSGDRAELEKAALFLTSQGGSVLLADTVPFEVSSSQIRMMIRNGGDAACYLNENVVEYIRRHNLYTEDDSIDG